MDTMVREASSRPTVTEAEAGAALAGVRAVTDTVGRLSGLVTDAASWPVQDRRLALTQLDRAVDGLAAIRAAVLLAERESGAWQRGGDRSFQAWRARTSLAGERAAAAQVRQAEHLAAVPSVAAAVTAGRIGLDQATTIGRVAAGGTPAQRAAVAAPERQAHLLRIAAQQDAATFATTVAAMVAEVDPEGLERDHQAQRRARFLHLSDTPAGTLIKGQVDSMAGHRLRLALEALSPRPGADDDRDPGQRRADALDTMVGRVLSSPDTKPGAHVPPHVSMILTEATWHAARAERDRRRRAAAGHGAPEPRGTGSPGDSSDVPGRSRAGRGADPTASGPVDLRHGGARPTHVVAGGSSTGTSEEAAPSGIPPATLEDGTPVPPSELAVAMCDCDLTRIVIDAEGAPVDLGRTQRLFTGPQRRAVIARDRECGWPSCHAPARWCDIHHIRWWDRDGGATAVELGVLLCSFHHHEVHRRDLAITRLAHPPHTDGSPPAPDVARVRYWFRDRSGRTIGEPSDRGSGREPPDGARGPEPPAPTQHRAHEVTG